MILLAKIRGGELRAMVQIDSLSRLCALKSCQIGHINLD